MKLRRGFTLIELLVVISIILLLAGLTIPTLSNARKLGKRAKCMGNMNGLHRAMYMYAGEFNQVFPVAEPNALGANCIGTFVDQPRNANEPGSGNSRSLFLLVKIRRSDPMQAADTPGFVQPQAFVCPGASDHSIPSKMTGEQYATYYDFPSYKNLSYSYQIQKKRGTNYYPTNVTTSGGVIILADRNPMAGLDAYWTSFSGGYRASPDAARYLQNSFNHGQDGQNVLGISGSVSWATSPNVGENYDNIWCPGKPASVPSGFEDAAPTAENDTFLWP